MSHNKNRPSAMVCLIVIWRWLYTQCSGLGRSLKHAMIFSRHGDAYSAEEKKHRDRAVVRI